MNKRLQVRLIRLALSLGDLLLHSFTTATFLYMFFVLMVADYFATKGCSL